MSLRTTLIGLLAAVGLGVGHSAQVNATNQRTERVAAIPEKSTGRSIALADIGSSGGLMYILRQSHTPYEWGISRACQKMRRKNHLRSKGVSGQKR
jgi:hypothetical protein